MKNLERKFSEVLVSIVNSDGTETMARCLLDTGCTKSMILKKFTNIKRRNKLSIEDTVIYETYGSTFKSSMTASVGFKMIEFNKHQHQTIEYEFQVDETKYSKQKQQYDMIIGNDLLWNMGINILYNEQQIQWNGDSIPLKSVGMLQSKDVCSMLYSIHTDCPLIKEAEDRQNKMLDADYSKVDISKMINNLEISDTSKSKLFKCLRRFENGLFGGGLGRLKNMKPARIKLKPGAIPYKGRYYNLPKAYETVAKKEIERLVSIGVLKRLPWNDDSPWASPSFGVPKKTGDIRIVTDFRQLNKWVEIDPFPLPRINESLQKLEKFKSATALDLSLGFYTIPLDEESKKLCSTILPWGKYAYERMPMGVSCAPGLFQAVMCEVLQGLDVLIYIDDVLIIQRENESEDDHLTKIEEVLERLETAGFKANLRKSFFMQKEVDYLGYRLTDNGIGPQEKKIEAMDRMLAPTTNKQLKRFLGMINFYRDIWEKRSHILEPLNKLSAVTSKSKNKTKQKAVPFVWEQKHQDAFIAAKQMIKSEVKLAFPDFTKPFHLYTDASDIQLGATLVQNGKPLGFYTRKLNSSQLNYTVGEKELLGIVEGLKTFEGVIRGQDLTIHTDHMNLLYQKLPSQRMMRWRLLLEEFHPKIVHIAGIDNKAADALSRLDMTDKASDLITWEKKNKRLEYINPKQMNMCLFMSESNFQDDGFDNDTLSHNDNYLMSMVQQSSFPLDLLSMKEEQLKDNKIISIVSKHIKENNDDTEALYTYKVVEDVELIHKNNRILVPESKQQQVLQWYHDILVHPGETRMIETIKLVFTWNGLNKQVKTLIKHCPTCQMCKKAGKKKYGLLPPKDAESIRWNRINVDLWGPKTIKNVNGITYEIHVMTMVDPVTGWFECTQLYGAPTAYRCQEILDNVWLSRYPRPKEIGFDNGSEFKAEFRTLCNNMGLKMKPSNAWNPQSNAILERVHQVLADGLLTFDLEGTPIDENNEDPFEEYLSAVSYALRSSYHQAHGHSPAQLIYGRDMFLPVSVDIDWDAIKNRKQLKINKSNDRENSSRIPHQYNANDLITLKKPGILRKLSIPRAGPYKVIRQNNNGSILIELSPTETQNVNIRRVSPYYAMETPNDNN
jgi:hypothetical protein